MTDVALVTGANRGLGLEVVRQLAQQGMTVILGSRDPEKGERHGAWKATTSRSCLAGSTSRTTRA